MMMRSSSISTRVAGSGITFDDIADLPIWVAWQNELRGPGERPTKMPYRAVGQRARSNDPVTWLTRDQAERCRDALPLPCGDGGLGVMLGVEIDVGQILIGLDVDTCRAPSGTLADWASEVVEKLATYAEISPSRTGAKAFGWLTAADFTMAKGMIGGGHNKAWTGGSGEHPPGFQLHLDHAYYTVTGDQLEIAPTELRRIDLEIVRWLVQEAGPRFERDRAGSRAGRDQSRSGFAWRLGMAMHPAGKSFDEFVAACRADPETAEWVREKGEANGGRELRRIWDKAGEADPAIAELNAEFALVLTGGKSGVLRERMTPDGWLDWDLLTTKAFGDWLKNRFVTIPGGKSAPLGDHWMRHPQRRQFDNIVFAPGRDAGRAYNLWQGFTVEPRPGDCSLFLDHLRENVAQHDDALYLWVVGWLADIVQHPGAKCGTALALRGKQGVGKTIVGKVFGSLLGRHYALLTQARHITGQFNKHLTGLLLAHADEAFWAGDKQGEGVIKSLITAETMMAEFKGVDIVRVDNHVRLLVTGNADWLVAAGREERRFAVLDVGDAHMQDIPYFAALEKQMKEGGREALLHHLLNFDLSRVNLRVIPKTTALLEQKIVSLNPEQSWLFDLLRSGRLPWGEDGGDRRQCKAELIFNSYIEHAKRQGVSRRAIETTLGMYLRKVFPTIPSPLPKVTIGYKRVPMYRFPPLAECRRRFADDFGQSLDHLWGDAQEDWDTEDEPAESYPIGKRW